MDIIIQRTAKKLRNGGENPKNYPYWEGLLVFLKDHNIIDISDKILEWKELVDLVDKCDFFISIDSMLQHLGWYRGKKGVVLWGQSNPEIFGHPENINILKDRAFLREKQFDIWENTEYNQTIYKKDAFLDAESTYKIIKDNFNI